MDPQLKKTCRQQIWVSQLTSRDQYGDPSFGPAQPLMARVEDDTETSDQTDGTETRSRKRIVTEDRINLTDRIWLPGDSPTDASSGRVPFSVQELPDELGRIDHYETIV